MSRRSRLVTDPDVPEHRLFVMADPSVHPHGTSIWEALALLYVCHPDEEQKYRDALAIAQEHSA